MPDKVEQKPEGERLAVLETEMSTGIRLLKEIRTDVKTICKVDKEQDLRIASLEQSRSTGRKISGVLGIPILGTAIHTILKSIGIY